MWPKRWLHLHWKGPFGVMYISTKTHRPHNCHRSTFNTSRPRITDTTKFGVSKQALETSWSWHPERSYKAPWTLNTLRLQLHPDDILRHFSPQILEEETQTAILWETEGVKTQTLALIKGSQSSVHNSEAISGPWDNQQPSPLIWDDRPLWYNAFNHIRKSCVSMTPET